MLEYIEELPDIFKERAINNYKCLRDEAVLKLKEIGYEVSLKDIMMVIATDGTGWVREYNLFGDTFAHVFELVNVHPKSDSIEEKIEGFKKDSNKLVLIEK